jgi:hypothetical protein
MTLGLPVSQRSTCPISAGPRVISLMVLEFFARAALINVAHGHSFPAFEHDLEGARMRAKVDAAGLLECRQEIHPARAAAQSLVDAALQITGAGLRRAVIIKVARNAEAGGAGDERLADLMLPIEVRHRNIAVAASIQAVAFADPPLEPLEIGQEIGVTPACVAALRPVVEIVGLTAVDDHAVDRARPADGPPHGYDHRASVDVR